MPIFTRQAAQLSWQNAGYRQFARGLLDFLFADDRGTGDATTALLGPAAGKMAIAQIVAKESGRLAGVAEAADFLRRHGVTVTVAAADGAAAAKGTAVLRLRGPAGRILAAERVALNCLQRMSGIATATAELVAKVGAGRVAATRKTPWGRLDRRAVVLGGGLSHRLSLADQILVKDNHRAFDAICWQRIPPRGVFEVEADTAAGAREVAQFFAGRGGQLILLLDNFRPAALQKLVPELRRLHPRVVLEASGGLTPANAAQFLATGVDYISLGSLTHSARVLDLSLEFAAV